MKPFIAVVDYEMGNLHSVSKAVEKAGGSVQVTNSASMIRRAHGVVLPGVGAFGQAVTNLSARKLLAPLIEVLEKNKPFLGICLGLQLLFERSEESPGSKGIGLFKGSVHRFRIPASSALKVPHMGWNTIVRKPSSAAKPLRGIKDGSYFYFVHSFFPVPQDSSIVATHTPYPQPFCSSVAKDHLFASQFHPEKSGDMGHKLLKNFVQEVAACS